MESLIRLRWTLEIFRRLCRICPVGADLWLLIARAFAPGPAAAARAVISRCCGASLPAKDNIIPTRVVRPRSVSGAVAQALASLIQFRGAPIRVAERERQAPNLHPRPTRKPKNFQSGIFPCPHPQTFPMRHGESLDNSVFSLGPCTARSLWQDQRGPRRSPAERVRWGEEKETERCEPCPTGRGECSAISFDDNGGKQAKRRQWRKKRACFEEAARLAAPTGAGNRIAATVEHFPARQHGANPSPRPKGGHPKPIFGGHSP